MSGVDQAAPHHFEGSEGEPGHLRANSFLPAWKAVESWHPVISREVKRSREISEQKVPCRDEPQKQQAE